MKFSENELNNNNIYSVIRLTFFTALIGTPLGYFLSWYLKEQGYGMLSIGFYFTIGLAIGFLLYSLFFAKLLKRISLSAGLQLAVLFRTIYVLVFITFPNIIGAFLSQIFFRFASTTSMISSSATIQHNADKENLRKVSRFSLIYESLAIVIGIGLCLILIPKIGFLGIVSLFTLFIIPLIIFAKKVSDKSRFVPNKKHKAVKLNSLLKVLIVTEWLFWFVMVASASLILTFLVTERLAGSWQWLGIMYLGLYGAIAISTVLTSRFDNYNLVKTTFIGMLLILMSSLIILFSQSLVLVLIALIIEGIGASIWVPSKDALNWRLIEPSQRETVAGYIHGGRTFFQIIAPLAGGALATYFGILAPFWFKAGVSLFALIVYVAIARKLNTMIN
ncbi:MAG: MFS transporter [Nanoarchaeota archaeon]